MDPVINIQSPSLPVSSAPVTPGRFDERGNLSPLSTNIEIVAPPPTPRDRVVLVRMDEAHAGQVSTADGAELRFGRHPSSTVVLDDEGISRAHARVFQADGRHYVEDLNSSNGTYVNGARVEKIEVHDGALIQLGPRVRFRFSVVDEHQERILRQLYQSSVKDSLTGAFNRQYFMERLTSELAYANRHGSMASVLLLDIDHFKKINDTYGHPAGDAVLKELAVAVQNALRIEDVFARFGGEEFVVLLRGVALDGAARAAERLRRAVASKPFGDGEGGQAIDVTVSVGCASVACNEDRSLETLIKTADRRLYAAKAAGRNRVVASG